MKTLFLCLGLLTSPLLLLSSFKETVPKKFRGDWYADKNGILVLERGMQINVTTLFTVMDFQLALECKNVFKDDTLYLYVIDSDQGRLFCGPLYPPKPKSLFAKCYLIKNELHIIYTQKLFSDHIKQWGLVRVMYRHK